MGLQLGLGGGKRLRGGDLRLQGQQTVYQLDQIWFCHHSLLQARIAFPL